MKLKKLVKKIYSSSYILVVDEHGNELFKGFAYKLLQCMNNNEFDNRKLIRIKEEYNGAVKLVLIKIYVK